ncbi:hypothetical protein GCM10020216_080220 [Nonomuraea helvata]
MEEPLLRSRGFRNLFVAGAVSQFGSQISYVALPLLAVTTLGAGAGEVGLLSALGTLTVLLLGLPAGAWVDRAGRRSRRAPDPVPGSGAMDLGGRGGVVRDDLPYGRQQRAPGQPAAAGHA